MIQIIALLIVSQVAATDNAVGGIGDRVGPIEKVLERFRKDDVEANAERDRNFLERFRVQADSREARLAGVFKKELDQAMGGLISDWRKERARDLAEKAKWDSERAEFEVKQAAFELKEKELDQKEQQIKIDMAKARRAEVWAKIVFVGALGLLALVVLLVIKNGGLSLLSGLLFKRVSRN